MQRSIGVPAGDHTLRSSRPENSLRHAELSSERSLNHQRHAGSSDVQFWLGDKLMIDKALGWRSQFTTRSELGLRTGDHAFTVNGITHRSSHCACGLSGLAQSQPDWSDSARTWLGFRLWDSRR